MDSGFTPQILVKANAGGVSVPAEFVQDGAIVLNIHDRAVNGLQMSNSEVSFSARFSGVSRELFIPVEAILAIYARENGQGLFFDLPESEEPGTGDVLTPSDQAETSESATPVRGKPNLKLV